LILVLLAVLVGVRRKWLNPAMLPPRTLAFLALSAVAAGASWVCYFRALQIGRASQVAPVDRLSLVLVAIFAVAFLGERPSVQEWLGIDLVTAGVLALTLK
jgi:transporter family protein